MNNGLALCLLTSLCFLATSCTPTKKPEAQTISHQDPFVDSAANLLAKEIDSIPSFTIPFSIEEEYKIHDSSMAADRFLGHVMDDPHSSFKAATAFSRYVQKNLLHAPSDYRFMADRKLLTQFERLHCDKDSVILTGNMMGNKPVVIKIRFADFEPKEHDIIYQNDALGFIESIDGKPVHGDNYEDPKRAIAEIKFCIGNEEWAAPTEAFQNMFQPMICNGSGFDRPIQAFTSMNQEYMYIYFFGGSAAGTYFAKLVFDQEKYVTRIITDYSPLSLHSSFHDGFIGF